MHFIAAELHALDAVVAMKPAVGAVAAAEIRKIKRGIERDGPSKVLFFDFLGLFSQFINEL